MPLPIEDYAAIGDGHTAGADRHRRLPRLAVPAPVRLTGVLRRAARRPTRTATGCWVPSGKHSAVRRYVGDTAVLETTYTTDTGEVRITDLMPTGDRRADVVRRVEGVRGTVSIRHSWVVRFDYGQIRPWVHREEVEGEPAIIATAGPDKLILTGPRLPPAVDGHHEETFDVSAGRATRLHAHLDPLLPDGPRRGRHRPPAGLDPRRAAEVGRRLSSTPGPGADRSSAAW